jgi:hypothetical protein
VGPQPAANLPITDFPSLDHTEENDMPVDDRTRLNLHRKLDTVLGSEEADTLMAHLPPVTWNEVTTKDDLAQSSAIVRSEMRAMSTELRGDMQALSTDLRGDMQALSTELRGDMQALSTELRGDMQALSTELRGDMRAMRSELRADFVEGTNRQIKWLVAFAAVWSSLLVTVVGLIA